MNGQLDDAESVEALIKDELARGPVYEVRASRSLPSGDEEHVLTVAGMRTTPEAMSETLAKNLMQNAAEFAGVSTYRVYFFPPSDDPIAHRTHRSVYYLRFEGDGPETDTKEGTDYLLESMSALKFMAGEAMTHSRQLHTSLLDANRQLAAKNENEVVRLTERVKFLEAGRDAMFIKEKELMLQQVALDKQAVEAQRQSLLMKHADKLLDAYLPTMTKKLLPGFLGDADKDKALKEASEDPAAKLIRSFTPEQLGKLQTIPFPPEVATKLSALVMMYGAGQIPKDADKEWDSIFRSISGKQDITKPLGELLTKEQDELLTQVIKRASDAAAGAPS